MPLIFWLWIVKREIKPYSFFLLEYRSDSERDWCVNHMKERIAYARNYPNDWVSLPEWMMTLYLKSFY